MRVKPSDADWKVADEVFRRFHPLPGSQHIASRYALAHLATVLRQNEIKSVVEFGVGIGTITYLLLTYPKPTRTVVSTERDAFCLEQLERNLPTDLRARLTVISDGSLPRGDFDLAVIDGKVTSAEYATLLRPGLICFVEGGRLPQRKRVMQNVGADGLNCNFRHHADRHLPRLQWQKVVIRFHWPRLNMPGLRQLFGRKSGCTIGVITGASVPPNIRACNAPLSPLRRDLLLGGNAVSLAGAVAVILGRWRR